MRDRDLVKRFRAARNDPSLAVLEGFHALKHALRFGAHIEEVATRDVEELVQFSAILAPDIERDLRDFAKVVQAEVFDDLAPAPPDTGVIAIARRRIVSAGDILGVSQSAPVVLLERPSHLGNIGAVIRVAASAGASAVITTGVHDPWHPAAIRGAAGLQYAIPVARTETLPDCQGPLVAIRPDGDPLRPGAIPSDSVLAFGSERTGLSKELVSRADHCIGVPMQPGVSSLNLATAVAVVLYAWRFAQ